MYKVIMAPTEGSDSEKQAIAVAMKLAQRYDAELRLVRVQTAPLVIESVPRPPVLEITEQTLVEERLARLRKLEALGTECRALGEIKVITALEDGPVASTLRDYASKFNVDLIVMSSHSRGGVKRVTLGSVTDYLIRHTNIPVLVVKPPVSFIGPTPQETLSRIVVPLDGSPLAAQILPQVKAFATRVNASVSLVQVLVPQTYAQKQIIQPGLPWWDADIAIAKEYLDGVAGPLVAAGLSVTTEVLLSEGIVDAILDFAARTHANMIAIATSGAGGMGRFVFGTVADEITRKSPISLLVFHPRQKKIIKTGGVEADAQILADV